MNRVSLVKPPQPLTKSVRFAPSNPRGRKSYAIGSLGGVTQTIIKILSLSPDRRAWVRATRDPPVPRPGTSSGPRTIGRCDVAPSRTHSWFSSFPSAEPSLLPTPNTRGPDTNTRLRRKGPGREPRPSDASIAFQFTRFFKSKILFQIRKHLF